MVGRSGDVKTLARIIGEQHTSVLLADERRFGKTTVALASIDTLRVDDRVALDCDLSAEGVRTPGALAAHLASLARAAGVGTVPNASTARRSARRILERLGGSPSDAVGDLIGDRDVANAINLIAALLGPAGPGVLSLDGVLRALQAHAVLADEPVVLLVDEIQALADRRLWAVADGQAVERALADAVRRKGGGLVLCMAGSGPTLVKKFFDKGRPLSVIGARFALQPIAYDDWCPALIARFAELGQRIDADALDAVLAEAQGHPRRTMLVCHYASQWARQNNDVVDDAVVPNAISDAWAHPSWS